MEVPAYYLHPHHYVRVRELLGEALAGDFTHLIPQLKFVKSPAELSYIRQAAQLADAAMQVFVEALKPGRSELELAGEIYHSLLSSGSGLAASPINLVSGERSCFSHGAPTHRRLKTGDCGNVEFGATYKRYTATIGRQFCLGEPSARLQEIYAVVRAACDACIANIRPGVPANTAHNAAKKIIEAAGLEVGRVHLSGYSLAAGFPPGWAEPFFLLDDNAQPFQNGMVVTVEPPVFLGEERLGVRIIDNVLVTEDGAKVLSGFSRDIISR
jgi:Xaa-Pro dipeptidase